MTSIQVVDVLTNVPFKNSTSAGMIPSSYFLVRV